MPIPIISELTPKGKFAIVDDANVRGGFRVVASEADLSSIPVDKLKEGMFAWSITEQAMYQLNADLSTWNPTSGFSGGLTLLSTLTGYVVGDDGSVLVATDSLLDAFQKLQVQLNTKAPKPSALVVTGTTVLDSTTSVVLINSLNACSIFLPAGVNNLSFRIRNVGSGKVTLIPSGTDTVEKASSYHLLISNSFDLIYYSGNWYIL